jgi:(p)ppGpp synthase/HD superfamily hydrolase
VSQQNRAETMAQKLVTYAGRAGIGDVALIEQAYWIAVSPRVEYFGNVFDFDVLHPARTALIIIELAGCRSADVIAAAQLTESYLPDLAGKTSDALPVQVNQIAAAVPNPLDLETAELVEALVTADDDVALIAVAERLDHARHLHMRDPSGWRPFYQQVLTAYLPVAERVHPELHARFYRWATAFERRLR